MNEEKKASHQNTNRFLEVNEDEMTIINGVDLDKYGCGGAIVHAENCFKCSAHVLMYISFTSLIFLALEKITNFCLIVYSYKDKHANIC